MKTETEAFKKENLIILALLLVTFLIVVVIYFFVSANYVMNFSNEQVDTENFVIRVIDGDTFELASGEIVRLLCVDTPEENQSGYEEAKQFLSELILNKKIRLEKNISEKDKYGRLLRYVYVNQTNENTCPAGETSNSEILSDSICFSVGNPEFLVNKEIISKGYGELFEYGSDSCDNVR